MKSIFSLIPRIAILGLVGFLAVSIHVVTAQASTVTTTFQVTANVTTACSVSASDLAFGEYDHTHTSPLDAVNAIVVTCTVGTAYNIGLDAGAGPGATVNDRKMSSGTSTLTYSLYQDAARTTVWGDTIGQNTMSGTASATFDTHTVYGRIPHGQDVPSSSYSDTITVTVTF